VPERRANGPSAGKARGSFDRAHAVAETADGKLLVAGLVTFNGGHDFALMRLNADGSLDASFGNGGKLLVPFAGVEAEARSMALAPDGKIVLAGLGFSWSDFSLNFTAARYLPSGVPDTSFNGTGKAVIPVGGWGQANDLAVMADGSIVCWEWDFDYDGASFDVDAAGMTATFSAADLDGPTVRTIALRVTDDNGASHVATTTVTVANAAPAVSIRGPASTMPNQPLTLVASISDVPMDTHMVMWDFGDGTSSGWLASADPAALSVSVAYKAVRTMTVTLTVVDDDGGTAVATHTISVAPPQRPQNPANPKKNGTAGEPASLPPGRSGAGAFNSDAQIVGAGQSDQDILKALGDASGPCSCQQAARIGGTGEDACAALCAGTAPGNPACLRRPRTVCMRPGVRLNMRPFSGETMALSVGFIGAGSMGRNHMKSAQCLGWNLAAVADIDAVARQEAVRIFGIGKAYETHTQLLADSAVDAVVIATPNNCHARQAIDALAAGRHVFLEKPMTTSLADADAIVAAVRKSGRILQMGMISRFRGGAQALKQFLANGGCGHIHTAQAFSYRRRGIPGFGGWFTTRAAAGGGALIDIGVHILDLALYLMDFPRPVAVSGMTYNVWQRLEDYHYLSMWGQPVAPGRKDVDDYAVALIRFADGQTLQLNVAWAVNMDFAPHASGVRIMGEKAGAALLGHEDLRIYGEQDGSLADTQLHFRKVEAGIEELRHFAECIREKRQPLATAEQGRAVQLLLNAIYQSSQEGREVRLD